MGRRPVAVTAIGLAIVPTVLFLVATTTAWLSAARILSGFAVGLASAVGAAWIAELTPTHDRGHAALLMTSSNFAGLALGPLVSGVPRGILVEFVAPALTVFGMMALIGFYAASSPAYWQTRSRLTLCARPGRGPAFEVPDGGYFDKC
jgi:MFS family permease